MRIEIKNRQKYILFSILVSVFVVLIHVYSSSVLSYAKTKMTPLIGVLLLAGWLFITGIFGAIIKIREVGFSGVLVKRNFSPKENLLIELSFLEF